MLNIKGLKELIVSLGMTYPAVSEGIGISTDSFNAIMQGKYEPNLHTLIKIADFFAVPLDFLAGRCTKEQAVRVLNDYPKHFMEVRRASYEQYMAVREKLDLPDVKGDIEAPYPYNLYEAILANNVDWVISEQQLKGLDWAMDSLTDKEKNIIYSYYRDGMTLTKIGESYGVTRERIRQMISKGVKKLKHPSRLEAILGASFNRYRSKENIEREVRKLSEMSENYQKNADALAKAESLVAIREQKINDIVAILKSSDLDDIADIVEKIEKVRDKDIEDALTKRKLNKNIEVLELSVRSQNGLLRAGIITVADIVNMLEYDSERFENIKNLGVKCREEIVDKLNSYMGENKYEYAVSANVKCSKPNRLANTNQGEYLCR